MDAVQTLTIAGLALFAGEGFRRALPVLARLHLPAAVLGGLAVALVVLLLPNTGTTPPVFDSALKSPLLVAFFTTLGFGASLPLLRAGGRQVLLFLGLATALAEPASREAALITFLAAAANITLLGIGGAFWGLFIGLIAHALLHGRWSRAHLSSRTGTGEQEQANV